MKPKTMEFRIVDSLFVVAYGVADPTPAEWDTYLDRVDQQGVERTRQLIVTAGGGPDARQRDALNRLLAGRRVRTAVVSSSRRVRLFSGALSWVNRDLRAFADSPAGLGEALAYLEVPACRRTLIERTIDRLRDELRAPHQRRGVA